MCANRWNKRILQQEGAFILSGLSKDSEDAEAKLQNMVFIKIIIKNKEKIISGLDALGINEATLFPELDNVTNYLKYNL